METIKLNYGTEEKLTGELLRNVIISQTFTAKNIFLLNFGVNFGTYRKNNLIGKIIFEILNESNGCIFTTGIDIRNILNDQFHEIITNIRLNINSKYTLKFYCPDGLNGKVPTAKFGPNKSGETFTISNKIIPPDNALYCYFTFTDQKPKVISSEQVKVNLEQIGTQLITSGKDTIEHVNNSNGKSLNSIKKEVIEKTPYVVKQSSITSGLISIIIPTYNTSFYLKNTLKSIIKQTYNNFEIIVSDDRSEEAERRKIAKAVDEYENDYSTHVYFNRVHRGAPGTRNIGADKSNGEYLFFCDSDVILEPSCLQKMIQALHQNNECSWAYCNYRLGSEIKSFQEFSSDVMYKKNLCSTMSLIRKVDFIKFNPKLKRLQDWEMFLSMIEKGKRGVWINEVLFFAEKREDGITFNSISWEDAVKDLKKLHPKLNS